MSPTLPPLAMIAAVSRNGIIGKGGQVPWDLPEDRAYFRDQTMGHAIIMGRRTWDETGRPLDGRTNIVVSRSTDDGTPGRIVVPNLEAAIAQARLVDPEPFVIGGAELYRLALPLATRLYLTEVDFDAAGDTHFPPFDRTQWKAVSRRPGDRASYVIYERQS